MKTKKPLRGRRGASTRSRGGASNGKNTFSKKRYGGGARTQSRGGRPQGRGGRRGGKRTQVFDPSQFIHKNPQQTKEEAYVPTHTFTDFALGESLHAKIAALGMHTPTPIQDKVIPAIIEGRDVFGLAETGTGKTAAFLFPLIARTLADMTHQTLILAPTRELAVQVNDELMRVVKGSGIFSTVCVGGMPVGPQLRSLKRENHFIIGTPGRLLDLLRQGSLVASEIRTVVLDEADRMLDMGFIRDIQELLGALPEDRNTLFFSATSNSTTEKLAHDILRNPLMVSVKKRDVTNSVAQDVVRYNPKQKFQTLQQVLGDTDYDRVLIFSSMKHAAEALAKDLNAHSLYAESIHGNKNHRQRQRALKRFKTGEVRILVATDVAARGIHVDGVSHVINYDLPNTMEDYIHRIGRTGRGGSTGEALTFVPNEKY